MSKDETRSDGVADSIECPNCGEEIHDLNDLEISGDYEHTDTECGACEATIKVGVRLSKHYVDEVA